MAMLYKNIDELEFPYDIIDVDPDVNSDLLKDFTGVCSYIYWS